MRNELYGNFFGLRPVVSYGGGRIGDGIPKKKLVKGSQAEANGTPTEVGGMSGKTRGINTHTHEQQLCSRNYSVVERMTDDGPLAASTLGVGDESRDLCARRSVVTCEKKKFNFLLVHFTLQNFSLASGA